MYTKYRYMYIQTRFLMHISIATKKITIFNHMNLLQPTEYEHRISIFCLVKLYMSTQ